MFTQEQQQQPSQQQQEPPQEEQQPQPRCINQKKRDRRKEKIRNCVSNFSLYASLMASRRSDPFDENPENEEPFKVKLSKSAKKRLRRQRKLKLSSLEKQVKSQIIKKKTKLDMKSIIKKINKL